MTPLPDKSDPAVHVAAVDSAADWMDDTTLGWMERIRAVEYARLELERRLDRAERDRVEMISAHRDELQAALHELAAARGRETARVARLEADAAALSDSLANARAEVSAQRTSLQAEHEQACRELAARHRDELDGERSAVAALNTELARVRAELDGANRAFEAERGALRAEAAHIRDLLQREQARADDLATRMVALQVDVEQARLAAARLDADLASLRVEAERLRRAAADAVRVAGERDAQLVESQALAARLQTQGVSLQNALAERNDRLRDAEQLTQAHEGELESRQRRIDELAGLLDTASSALRSKVAELDTALIEREAARQRLQECLVQLDAGEATIASLRSRVSALEGERRVLRESVSFAVGQAVTGLASASGLRAFPRRLVDIARRMRGRRANARTLGAPEASPQAAESFAMSVTQAYALHGVPAVRSEVERSMLADGARAQALTELVKRIFPAQPQDALQIGRLAHRLDPAPFRTKWLAFMAFDAGEVTSAAALLDELPAEHSLRPSERHKAAQIEGSRRLLQALPKVPPRAERSFEPVDGRVLYVAASALPYHQSGYTVRTQALTTALCEAGIDVRCATRPGYPADRPDTLVPADDGPWQIGEVHYRAIPGPGRRRLPPDAYVESAADAVFELITELRPAVVHAASNYENALPVLMAARRAGIPFVYEVRGLWELSAASRMPGWAGRERYRLERDLETLVARDADRVVTLNTGLADELIRRGVDASSIALAPNAVDETLAPVARDAALASDCGIAPGDFVVGYAGSLVGYEGLDLLLDAAADVRRRWPGLRVVIVGDGPERGALERRATELGLADRVHFAGRVAPERVAAYMALFDCAALPRRPDTVCEVVSPLKPLEAMALGVPLVVSDVAALREMVEDGVTGLVHRAGDVDSLIEALQALAADPARRESLAAAAREHVRRERTWAQTAARVRSVYAGLDAGFANGTAATPSDPIGELQVAIPAGRNTLDANEKAAIEAAFHRAFGIGGAAAVESLLARQITGRSQRFAAFCTLKAAGCCLQAGDADAAGRLARVAVEHSADPATLKGAATIHFNAVDDDAASAMLERMAEAAADDPGLARLERQVEARRRLVCEAGVRRPLAIEPIAGRSVNFLHFSLPYASVGYATRSHGIALGVKEAGWDIRPYTRPGFPHDFKPEYENATLPDHDDIDGIRYGRLIDGGRKGTSEAEYLLAAADHCEAVLRRERPAVVHAASNYTTALPALIAARRLGLPFVYEIRGFWEITRSSRDAAFEKTIKFRAMQFYEELVVREADRVVTITTAMKEELIARGVPADRIGIAYNSVDPSRFHALPRDRGLAERLGLPEGVPVIGYIGSIVDYEGLDDLVRACAMLRARGVAFRLMIVGDGAALPDLRAMVDAEGLADIALLPGRVPHEEVEAYYSLVDVAPFPRKPWPVCELVSPLKPFEAMAMEKAVVVSGTRALLEIVTDGLNGFVFDKGSVAALADVLGRLLADSELRARTGSQARGWVEEFRSWRRAGRDVVDAYAAVLADRPVEPGPADRR